MYIVIMFGRRPSLTVFLSVQNFSLFVASIVDITFLRNYIKYMATVFT